MRFHGGLLLLTGALLLPASATRAQESTDGHAEAWLKAHLESIQRALAARPGERVDARYDLGRVDLQLTPSLSTASLAGVATLCVRSLQDGLADLDFDLHDNLAVSAVDGALSFSHGGNVLHCVLPAPLALGAETCLTVHYAGDPASTGFGSYQLALHAGVPIVSTLSEPNGAPSWWPTKDDPSDKADSADVRITVPLGQVATSNGRLLSADTTGALVTWHWRERHPIATYLVCMSVTNYQLISDEYTALDGSPMPVDHYIWPEDHADALIDFNVTVPMIGFYATTFGEYPFVDEKYGHSEFTWGGAMEHQCNTSYGSTLLRGDHAYDYIVAHELAHQWFGDKVTCAAWEDIWLNEGFATYSEALWMEHLGGHAALVQHMTGRCYVTDPSGPIYDPPSTFNSNTVYRKGAWLLHMLRGQVGDSAFFALMNGWTAGPFAYGSAHVADFTAHAAQYTPRDLTGLWNGYLFGLNRPSYRTDWRSRSVGGLPVTELRVQQIQAEAPFDLWLPWRINVGTLRSEWVRNRLRLQGHVVVTGTAPSAASVDPDDWLLETHATGNLSGLLRHLALRVQAPDGSFPGAGGLRARCGTSPGGGAWVDGLAEGVVALELGELAPDWSAGDSLWIEVESAGGMAGRLAFGLAPSSADWQDLGLRQLQALAPPQLTISLQSGGVLLEWTAQPGASAYRVEAAGTPWSGDWLPVGETVELSLALPAGGDERRCLRVVALY